MVVIPVPLVLCFQIRKFIWIILFRSSHLFQQAAGFITHVCFYQPQEIFQIKDRFTPA